MKIIYTCLCFATVLKIALPAPANGFVFPDDRRREKKLEPVITPPVLPVIEHLENDPSTLLPHERRAVGAFRGKPRFGGGFNVAPSGNGGLTASVSSSASGLGASQSASQSFAIGFNEGFSASHSASQATSFNGFGSGFSGSQASSQSASFSGSGLSGSGSASSASALGSSFGGSHGRPASLGGSFAGSQSGSSSLGGHFGGSQSQSAASAFGFNSLGGFQQPEPFFGDGLIDVRNQGVPNFPFPNFFGKGIGAAAFRSGKSGPSPRSKDDFLAVVVSD